MNLLTYYFIFIQSYYYSLFYLCIVLYTEVSISTDGQRNASATLLIEVGYFFQKEEATSLNNIVNRKYIIKSECKSTIIMMPTDFIMLVMLYFSHFFTSFLKHANLSTNLVPRTLKIAFYTVLTLKFQIF